MTNRRGLKGRKSLPAEISLPLGSESRGLSGRRSVVPVDPGRRPAAEALGFILSARWAGRMADLPDMWIIFMVRSTKPTAAGPPGAFLPETVISGEWVGDGTCHFRSALTASQPRLTVGKCRVVKELRGWVFSPNPCIPPQWCAWRV